MLAININSPEQIMMQLKDNFKYKRLSFDLTQEGLASKSGVSLGSLKRFERSGQISIESLLLLAVVLDCLDDFIDIANTKKKDFKSIDELLKTSNIKKRGSIK